MMNKDNPMDKAPVVHGVEELHEPGHIFRSSPATELPQPEPDTQPSPQNEAAPPIFKKPRRVKIDLRPGPLMVMKEESDSDKIMALMSSAAESGNVELAERFVALFEKLQAKAAEIAFNKAFAALQAEIPPIRKDGKADRYSYATLEAIDTALKPLLARHNFSVSYGCFPAQLSGHYGVEMTVSHIDGHSRTYKAEVPSNLFAGGQRQIMTPVQMSGAIMSYAQRYIKKLAFDLLIENEDVDARRQPTHQSPQSTQRYDFDDIPE